MHRVSSPQPSLFNEGRKQHVQHQRQHVSCSAPSTINAWELQHLQWLRAFSDVLHQCFPASWWMQVHVHSKHAHKLTNKRITYIKHQVPHSVMCIFSNLKALCTLSSSLHMCCMCQSSASTSLNESKVRLGQSGYVSHPHHGGLVDAVGHCSFKQLDLVAAPMDLLHDPTTAASFHCWDYQIGWCKCLSPDTKHNTGDA